MIDIQMQNSAFRRRVALLYAFLSVCKDLISAGHVKPGLDLMIFYAEHEGEDFIEEILYPFGYENQKLENRKNRAPRALFDFFIEFLYADDATDVLDFYPCETSGTIRTLRNISGQF